MTSLPSELQDFMRPIVIPQEGPDYQKQFRALNPLVESPYERKVFGIPARWALMAWSVLIVLFVPMLLVFATQLYPYNERILNCSGACIALVFLIILLSLIFKKISVLDYMKYALMFTMVISTMILIIIGFHIASLFTGIHYYFYQDTDISSYLEKDLAYAIITVFPLLACTAAYFTTETAFDDICNTETIKMDKIIEEIELAELEAMENSYAERLIY